MVESRLLPKELLQRYPGTEMTDLQQPQPSSCVPEDEVARNVAQCLRKLGDEYNAMIESHIKKLKPELNHLAKKQSMEIFSSMVTELSNNSEMQTYRQQLGFEMTLLKIAVTLGLGIVKESPSLLPAVKDVMVNFINSKLLSWVQRSGGWEKACSL
ncbi:apoptosis regulator BAX-like isoform X2 [Stegostoma tigrinum]|uniref:apoptosis regulator BAX-like isoform X2 n=1 Tax=Stegostoma tigrinum TaxID=3053191 RepID=UPI002870B2D7|nr:apoptosis regulator BAX-like isoform X2 [Stegostoma tigrinum]